VDRHPQYRHYPTVIRVIVSGIIIEFENDHIISLAHLSERVLMYIWRLQDRLVYKIILISSSGIAR
jgi:hypothetical protein